MFIYPILFAIMKNRRYSDYILLLTTIKKMFADSCVGELSPTAVHTDGELSAIKAYKLMFNCPIKLCVVHFFRNWDSHLDDCVGKTNTKNKIIQTIRVMFRGAIYMEMEKNEIRQRLIRYATELTDHIQSYLQTGTRKFITYVCKNYFDQKALFPPADWNFQHDILQKTITDQTNNVSESVNRQFKANLDHGFKTFHKATAGINKFKTKYYQKFVRKHQKGKFNRRKAKTVRNEQTAAQLLFEYTSLSTDKQVEYLPNYCIKLALKQANGDTKKEELALHLLPIIEIEKNAHPFINNNNLNV